MANHAMNVTLSVTGAGQAAQQFQKVGEALRRLRPPTPAAGVGGGGGGAAAGREGQARTGLTTTLERLNSVVSEFSEAASQVKTGAGGAVAGKAQDLQNLLSSLSSVFGKTNTAAAAAGEETATALSGVTQAAGSTAASLGPLVGTIALVGTALQKLVESARRFAEQMARAVLQMVESTAKLAAEFRHQVLTTGGTSRNIAFLRAVGADPSQAAGLRSHAATSPLAQMQLGRMGIRPVLPRELDPGFNEAQFEEQVIRKLAEFKNPADRFAAAVRLDATALLESADFYARHKRQVDLDAAVLGKLADTGFQRAGSDLLFQLERVKKAFQNLAAVHFKPFLDALAKGAGAVADAVDGLALALAAIQHPLSSLQDLFRGLALVALDFGKVLGKLLELWGTLLANLSGGALGGDEMQTGKDLQQQMQTWQTALQSGWEANRRATQENTDAVNENNALVREGMHGGGPRSQRAVQQRVPGLYDKEAFDRATAGGAYALGRF